MTDTKIDKALFAYKEKPTLEAQILVSKLFLSLSSEERKVAGEKIKEVVKDRGVRHPVNWSMMFEGHRKFWKEVYLLEKALESQESLDLVNEMLDAESPPSRVIALNGAVSMCHSVLGNQEDTGLEKEIKQIWLDVFVDFPEFNVQLLALNKKLDDLFKRAYPNFEKDMNPENAPAITHQKCLSVPLNVEGSSLPVESLLIQEDVKEFLTDRETEFNNFKLQGYIEMVGVEDIHLVHNGSNCVLTVGLSQDVDMSKLKEELLGQLSDGFGENLEQRPLVVGKEKVFFGFDVSGASEWADIAQPKQTRKLR